MRGGTQEQGAYCGTRKKTVEIKPKPRILVLAVRAPAGLGIVVGAVPLAVAGVADVDVCEGSGRVRGSRGSRREAQASEPADGVPQWTSRVGARGRRLEEETAFPWPAGAGCRSGERHGDGSS